MRAAFHYVRKVRCVFSVKVGEVEMHFTKGKSNYVLNLAVSGWENKRQTNMNTENYRRSVER